MVLPDIQKRIIHLENRNKVLEEMIHELTTRLENAEGVATYCEHNLSYTADVLTILLDYLGEDFAKYFLSHKYNTES